MKMSVRECYHCKLWVEEGEDHDCWTTTEAALTRDLSDDLRDAWERLRETAAEFGEQRIYAAGHSIMFSRKSCYFFVRPKKKYLEVCVFLARRLQSPLVNRADQSSKSKFYHLIRITHRDQVEAPFTDWLREAWERIEEAAPVKPVQAAGKAPPEKRGPAPKLDKGKQLTGVRQICESIPGVVEKLSHGMPIFLTPKRVFAMFADNHHADGHIAVWIAAAAGVQEELIADEPKTYFRPPYVGGSGWVGVELPKVNDEQLGALLREAFRVIDSKSKKPSPRPSARPAKSAASAAASPAAPRARATPKQQRKQPASARPPRARAARASTKSSKRSAPK
jgi:hypothetical protein